SAGTPIPDRPPPIAGLIRRRIASREALLGRLVDARVVVVGLLPLPLLFVRRLLAIRVPFPAHLVVTRAGFAGICMVLVRSLFGHEILRWVFVGEDGHEACLPTRHVVLG